MVQMARQKETRETLTFLTALLASLPFSLPFFFYSQSLLIFPFEWDTYMSKAFANTKGLFHSQGTRHEMIFLITVDRCPAPAFFPPHPLEITIQWLVQAGQPGQRTQMTQVTAYGRRTAFLWAHMGWCPQPWPYKQHTVDNWAHWPMLLLRGLDAKDSFWVYSSRPDHGQQ